MSIALRILTFLVLPFFGNAAFSDSACTASLGLDPYNPTRVEAARIIMDLKRVMSVREPDRLAYTEQMASITERVKKLVASALNPPFVISILGQDNLEGLGGVFANPSEFPSSMNSMVIMAARTFNYDLANFLVSAGVHVKESEVHYLETLLIEQLLNGLRPYGISHAGHGPGIWLPAGRKFWPMNLDQALTFYQNLFSRFGAHISGSSRQISLIRRLLIVAQEHATSFLPSAKDTKIENAKFIQSLTLFLSSGQVRDLTVNEQR